MNNREVLKAALQQAFQAWLAVEDELRPCGVDGELEERRTGQAALMAIRLLDIMDGLLDIPEDDVTALDSVLAPLHAAVRDVLGREVAA